MKWAHDKAKCGICGWKSIGHLDAQDRVQKHQNAKHGGSGERLSYDKEKGKWEDELR